MADSGHYCCMGNTRLLYPLWKKKKWICYLQRRIPQKWLMIHTVSNNRLKVDGILGRGVAAVYHPKRRPGQQTGNNLVVILWDKRWSVSPTQSKLYSWTMRYAACTWWWWYNGVAGKQRRAGSVWEEREMERRGETDTRAPREWDGENKSCRDVNTKNEREREAKKQPKRGGMQRCKGE